MRILFLVLIVAPFLLVAFILVRRFIISLTNLNQAKTIQTTKSKQTYWVAGYSFPSYYIAKAYARDNGYDASSIKIVKGDK